MYLYRYLYQNMNIFYFSSLVMTFIFCYISVTQSERLLCLTNINKLFGKEFQIFANICWIIGECPLRTTAVMEWHLCLLHHWWWSTCPCPLASSQRIHSLRGSCPQMEFWPLQWMQTIQFYRSHSLVGSEILKLKNKRHHWTKWF